MTTGDFDALISFSPSGKERHLDALLFFQGKKVPASFYFYQLSLKEKPGFSFVRVHPTQPLWLKWKDKFKVKAPEKKDFLAEGCVLNPSSEQITRKRIEKRMDFLKSLLGDEKEMALALAREKGMQGLEEKEMMDFSSLTRKSFLRLAQELEAEGKIRILSFNPLYVFSQEGLDFLCQKILDFLARFHEKNPGQSGASLARVKGRFNLHPRILSLALRHLERKGEIKGGEDKVALSAFKATFTPEEERVLMKLEDMCFKGEFRSVSLEELQKRFRLSSNQLNRMLSLLIERKKIVQGKDGFLLHSRWLDEIIWRIKKSGKKELTVSDFKRMTGLSRKYAIPLLELLDRMGVTRRKGPLREIL